MKKTEDQKEFEKFLLKSVSKEERTFYKNHVLFRHKKENFYCDETIKFGFDCWMESKRIQREHAQG